MCQIIGAKFNFLEYSVCASFSRRRNMVSVSSQVCVISTWREEPAHELHFFFFFVKLFSSVSSGY